jgi:hypothetical protein
MKKIFVFVMVISICSISLTSSGWAFWPFPPWKNNEQKKIYNLEKQLQAERQIKEDAQTKISDLEYQLLAETQMKESAVSKISDLEKQLQIVTQLWETAQKDKELAQQYTANAERSRGLWMGISAAVGLICLLFGMVIGSKTRRAAKIQRNADGEVNNELE